MNTSVFLVLLGLLATAAAKPTFIDVPTLTYATLVSASGAPVGPDGRVVDTPEVLAAKNQHAAAQLNERVNLAREAARSGEVEVPASAPTQQAQVNQVLVTQSGGLARILTTQDLGLVPLTLTSLGTTESSSAPVGPDGRVVDTPAVARAKAEHAAAHLNSQLQLVNEARNSGVIAISGSPSIALRL